MSSYFSVTHGSQGSKVIVGSQGLFFGIFGYGAHHGFLGNGIGQPGPGGRVGKPLGALNGLPGSSTPGYNGHSPPGILGLPGSFGSQKGSNNGLGPGTQGSVKPGGQPGLSGCGKGLSRFGFGIFFGSQPGI